MSAPLPSVLVLPAHREYALVERALAELPPERRAEALFKLGASRRVMTEAMSELRHLPLVRLDDWSRQTFRALMDGFLDFLHLFAKEEVVHSMRVELDAQRAELLQYLRPLKVEAQAEWALVTLSLVLEALLPQLARGPIPSREEFAAQLAQVDFAGDSGAAIRALCFLTLILEAARSGEPADERIARYAALAFLNAQALRGAVARETGLHLDPLPWLSVPRGEAARSALARLLDLPADNTLAARLDADGVAHRG
jgi:hypothetical protein